MTFEIIKGDLFDPTHEFDALAQGVNTWGNMGGGVAVPFRERWPNMYTEYRMMCDTYGEALGGLMHIYRPSRVLDAHKLATIYNLFSQIEPGPDGSYTLLQKATIMLVQDAELQRYESVGLPWIGCGIAGLAQHNVRFLFDKLLSQSDVRFVLVEQ